MRDVTPYNNISSFMAFRTDDERAAYEDVHAFNRNWFDRASNPEFRQYEQNILEFVQKLHNNYFEWGFLTVDSSEAIYCALLAHLLRFKERGANSCPNLVISKLGHVAYKKAAVLLGFEIREVEILDNGEISLTDLSNKIDKGTFTVVALAGTTALGNYDNIIEMDKICKKMGVPIHIDAAIGGFIYPFRTDSKIPSDFKKCNSVVSVNISGHKYGYSRPSVAILLFKNKSLLPKKFYSFSIPYLDDKDTEEYGLMGSKSPIGLIDLNFNVTAWGQKGYKQIVAETFRQKERLITALKKFDDLEIIDTDNTPIFLISGNEALLVRLSKYLKDEGWFNSFNRLFKDRASIRIVVRKHFDDAYVDNLVVAVARFFKSAKPGSR